MSSTDIYKLDRIENGIAAVENPDGATLYVSAGRFPENSRSGDCFSFQKGCFIFEKEETEKRRKKIQNLLDEIMAKNV